MCQQEVQQAMEKIEATMAPSQYRAELRRTALALVAPGKGLLACDEPPHVLPNRMKMCWSDVSECTEEWRRCGCLIVLLRLAGCMRARGSELPRVCSGATVR